MLRASGKTIHRCHAKHGGDRHHRGEEKFSNHAVTLAEAMECFLALHHCLWMLGYLSWLGINGATEHLWVRRRSEPAVDFCHDLRQLVKFARPQTDVAGVVPGSSVH